MHLHQSFAQIPKWYSLICPITYRFNGFGHTMNKLKLFIRPPKICMAATKPWYSPSFLHLFAFQFSYFHEQNINIYYVLRTLKKIKIIFLSIYLQKGIFIQKNGSEFLKGCNYIALYLNIGLQCKSSILNYFFLLTNIYLCLVSNSCLHL